MSVGIPELIVVTAVDVLFPGSGSGVEDVTVAVLTRLPYPEATRTTISRVTTSPTARVPSAAVTVPVDPTDGPAQVPTLVEQETYVVLDGSGSVSATSAAASGPALMTRIV